MLCGILKISRITLLPNIQLNLQNSVDFCIEVEVWTFGSFLAMCGNVAQPDSRRLQSRLKLCIHSFIHHAFHILILSYIRAAQIGARGPKLSLHKVQCSLPDVKQKKTYFKNHNNVYGFFFCEVKMFFKYVESLIINIFFFLSLGTPDIYSIIIATHFQAAASWER